MKLSSVTSLALGVLLAAVAVGQTRRPPKATSQSSKVPRYVAVREEVDVGEVRRGQHARFEFTIRNAGSAPLTLDVKANCSCTLSSYDRVLAPGAEGKVIADLNTDDLKGHVTKTLTVRTNDPRHPVAGLYMIATVTSIADVDSGEHFTMPLNDEGPTVKELMVRFRGDPRARLVRIASASPGLQATFEPVEQPDGVPAYRIVLTASPGMPTGATTARLTLLTTSELEPQIRLTVRCEKGIVVMPNTLYLGTFNNRPQQPVVRTVTLTRHSGTFTIKRITPSDSSLTVTTVKLRDATGWQLTVKWKPRETGWIQQAIVVETDDVRQPRLVIPVMARIGVD